MPPKKCRGFGTNVMCVFHSMLAHASWSHETLPFHWAELTTMQLAPVISKLCLHCHLSDASSQVSCWVPSNCFANMPLRCVSVVLFRGALGTCKKSWFCVHGIVRRALRKSSLGFLPKAKKCPTGHPQASLRPNAKTSGWRCARRWLQRPWSRCLGEFL